MMVEAFDNLQNSPKGKTAIKSGVSKKKGKYSINVIHFVPDGSGSGKDPKFSKIASSTRGQYKRIEGMAAIQSYVSADRAD